MTRTFPGRLKVLLCALLLALPRLPAWGICRPEIRVGGSPAFSSVLASLETAKPIEPPQETPGCGYDFASGVHKYLYAQADPVNGIDPSGNAVWFVERTFASGVKQAGWYLNAGHGYLVFTSASDPGTEADPFTGGEQIASTFSWHPETFNYNSSNTPQTPGRVWEDGPGDRPTGSVGTGYYPFWVTSDPSAQAQLMTCIRNWIASDNSGYDFGPARPQPGNPSNQIGIPSEHRDPPENSVYYSVMEQNCVWWATIMLKQSKISVPQSVYDAIKVYEGGFGAAAQVINGTRSATKANTIDPIGAQLRSIAIPESVGTSFTGI